VIATLFGGIGLFLLGMALLTDGLKATAGSALRGILQRFTGGRLRSIASGAAITALVQSSSATTLATIGFVSAGMLTLNSAVGVVMGANLGTTSTGWLVSILGLNMKISAFALPLVGTGVILRLAGRGRWPAVGTALAGFGLIFIGIGFLQDGMADLARHIDLGTLAGGGLATRLLLVGAGTLMTVLMQSSSAAVATTLTALHSGAIGELEAAALVIGQNLGTTVTAALAAVGATVAAKRTAVAHILFNVVTAVLAFLLLPWLVSAATALVGTRQPAVTVAAFHTLFNLLGVAVMLPFVARLAAALERIVPERAPSPTRYLDSSVADLAPVAVEAARRAVAETALVALRALREELSSGRAPAALERHQATVFEALDATRTFLRGVHTAPDMDEQHHRHVAVLHAVDHLHRLAEKLGEQEHLRPLHRSSSLAPRRIAATPALQAAEAWLAADSPEPAESPVALWERTWSELADFRRHHRREVLLDMATGARDIDEANARLEAAIWLDGVAFHAYRVLWYLAGSAADSGQAAPQGRLAVTEEGSEGR
jgi:phosphate:Na+ symporter